MSLGPIVVGILKIKCTVSGWIEAGTSLVLVKQKNPFSSQTPYFKLIIHEFLTQKAVS